MSSLGCRSSRFVGHKSGLRHRRALQWLASTAFCVFAMGAASQHDTSAAGLLPYTHKFDIPAVKVAPAAPAHRHTIPTASGFVSIAGTKAVRWSGVADNVIRVRVEMAPDIDGWMAGDTMIVRRAFEAWERQGAPVRFQLDSSADADVVVHWVDHFDGPMSGWTTVNWDDRGEIHHGDVRLALRTPTGRRLNAAERILLATHEFGHVLGLGHTTDATSIMASVIYAHDIGPLDMQSIQRLYSYDVASR